MATIKDKIYFNFDNSWSYEFNLISVSLDSGMFEETFVASREILETKLRGNDKPLFAGVDTSPLQFDMVIAFEEEFSDDDLDRIIRWLFVDFYKPLYFEGKEDKIYYCMPVDEPKIVHNGLNQGYFTVTMRCNSSKIYSQEILTDVTTVGTTALTISLSNLGHYDIYPEISIKKINPTGVTTETLVIENLTDGDAIFEVLDLYDQENIYIDCSREIIESDIAGRYLYDNVVGDFIRLLYGNNDIKITGGCEIQFRFKDEYKF